MRRPRRRAGATLPEIIVLMALLAVLCGMTVSTTARTRDGIAVRAARDAVAGEIGKVGALARLHGSARMTIALGALAIEAPAGTLRDSRAIGRRFGVDMSVDGAAGAVTLEFDALGLGRLVNRTIRFRRNDAEAGLTLSSYGRPRRW